MDMKAGKRMSAEGERDGPGNKIGKWEAGGERKKGTQTELIHVHEEAFSQSTGGTPVTTCAIDQTAIVARCVRVREFVRGCVGGCTDVHRQAKRHEEERRVSERTSVHSQAAPKRGMGQ